MILSRVFPGQSESIDLDDPQSRNTLLDWYSPAALSTVRVNLVASITGSAGGGDNTSHTLTNPVDRRILGVIRELSDIVLVGAQTVRAEGYLLPKRVPLAILTATGDLAGHGIAADVEPGRLFVLCPATSVARVEESLDGISAEIIALAGDSELKITDVVTALRIRGFESIVCEGGPSLAAQLISADLVSEVCLTTSPLVGGAAIPLLAPLAGGERRATLTQLLVDDGSAVYARWTLLSDPEAAAALTTS